MPVSDSTRLLASHRARVTALVALTALTSPLRAGEAAARDWPMLAHDAARSGASAVELRPPFERKWYRLFDEEGIQSGVQPIVCGAVVYLGTLRGILHAIDSESGRDRWSFRAGGAILHAAAADTERVYFGCGDGKVYALRGTDGSLAWTFPTSVAIWNAPALAEGLVVIGGRDGTLYALEAGEGKPRWALSAGAPILASPAVDLQRRRVYFAPEDMTLQAADLDRGQRLWRSARVGAVSFRGYHPVVAPDGAVLLTAQPAAGGDFFQGLLLDMVKEVFGDFASWRHSREENERLRRENFALLEKPETFGRQIAALRRVLSERPALRTLFVFDPETGRERGLPPAIYSESMNGTAAPPIVTADGRVVVKFQALLRSRYEHYSPFLNPGWLDTASGAIEPLMDQGRTYGWHDSLLLVHDEQCQLAAGGSLLFNSHQNDIQAIDLKTLRGFPFALAHNIHEPEKGESAAIWARRLRGAELPSGKEWLLRGTGVYGGGSTLDTSIAIAGDSFYWLPTHEASAGAALIAYRMQPDGTASKKREALRDLASEAELERLAELPWDWDMLAMPRLRAFAAGLPQSVAGARARPLWEEAKAKVAAIADSALERVVWEELEPAAASPEALRARRDELRSRVEELLERGRQALIFPAAKHPREAYRLFDDPSETLCSLALAWPYLDASAQERLMPRVEEIERLARPVALGGEMRFPRAKGLARSFYEPPSEDLLALRDLPKRDDLARLDPVWRWRRASGRVVLSLSDWEKLRPLADALSRPVGEAESNARLAGLIAFCRWARHFEDQAALERGLAATRAGMRERLTFELAHTRGGLIAPAPVERSTLARWRRLTPELGRFLSAHAGSVHRQLMALYVDYHRPAWWLAWNVETLWRNEAPNEFPEVSLDIFAARAWILGEDATRLERCLDIPWCHADEYYLQKLAMTLAAARL